MDNNHVLERLSISEDKIYQANIPTNNQNVINENLQGKIVFHISRFGDFMLDWVDHDGNLHRNNLDRNNLNNGNNLNNRINNGPNNELRGYTSNGNTQPQKTNKSLIKNRLRKKLAKN
jgi:hypothetical protein